MSVQTWTKCYSSEQIAELYYHRRNIELFFRDIKTTLNMDVLREWLPRAGEYAEKPRKLAQWREELLAAIASVTNPHRPERQEPRAKKRRPKTHQLLTKPRHEFQEIPHREKYRKAP